MENFARNTFWVSVALLVVGIGLAFAAAADAIPYFLGDTVGAYIAFFGAAGLGSVLGAVYSGSRL